MSERIGSRPRKPPPLPFSSSSSPKSQTLTLKMRKSPLLKPILFLSFSLSLLAVYVFLSTTSISSFSQPNPNPNPNPKATIPKIYVHELPKKFTGGVVERYAAARKSELVRYPGHQHSAEWALLEDLNRPHREGSPVERVSDPDQTDLFYVPFFSSLSLIVNPIRPAESEEGKEPTAYSDEDMQEELMNWLEGNEYWKRNNGRDHVFIAQDPNALYKVIDRVRNGILLVSDFGRLKGDQASLVKDVIVPYSHRINSYNGEVGVENRQSMLFFMGNRYRKEGGKVRDTLFQILENEKDVIIKHGAQSRVSRRMASQGMHSSKFCLHPAGDTPSACRLFDAIVSLCVPVIVSDYIELPFEDVIDYRKIAVFVDTESAVKPGYLTSLLRGISVDRILQYQRELKLVKHYFEYDDPNGTVNEIWRQVASKVPLIKLMINRDKRLVKRDLDDADCSCLCTRLNGTSTQQ